MANELRFGVVSESVPEGRAWLEHARRVEGEGVAALLLRDHFSAGAFGPQLAPFSALAAAAAVTERLRVGTMVLCNDFRHPAIVAHEAATLHQLSGGRFELGLGPAGTSPNTPPRVSPSTRRASGSTGWRSHWPSSPGCWTAAPCGTRARPTRSTAWTWTCCRRARAGRAC